MPHDHHPGGRGRDDRPGRSAFAACNYTCMYLLGGLDPGRFQVQILHEYDSCCFSPHGRHNQMLAYEADIRAELMAEDRAPGRLRHGWFTTTANTHVKHEVSAQDKAIIAAAMAGRYRPGSDQWQLLPCDILHRQETGDCLPDVEPGYPEHEPHSEGGYVLLGHGACRDSHGRYPSWGTLSGDGAGNDKCKRACDVDISCDAYMSIDWSPMDVKRWRYCQFYCTEGVGGLCSREGSGGGRPSTTDHSDPTAFCWLKQRGSLEILV